MAAVRREWGVTLTRREATLMQVCKVSWARGDTQQDVYPGPAPTLSGERLLC